MTQRRRGAVALVMLRELRIVTRGRGAVTGIVLLAAVAWLPPLLLPLRGGRLGVASFGDLVPLALAAEGVLLSLLALLFGADSLAGEIEDGSLKAVVTLPLSRTACFTGKLFGRVLSLLGAQLVLFGSAGIVIGLVNGTDGWTGYARLQVFALLLTVTCTAIGAAIAAGGRGRVHVYAVALLTWVALVFVVDAVLLAGIVVLAPEAPQQVGEHGHSEMATAMPADPSASSRGPGPLGSPAAWLLTLDPVDLFRLGALSNTAALDGPGGGTPPASSVPMLVGWLIWLGLPFWIGLARFRRLPLP